MVTNARAKPWLMIALLVSLGLNLFLGGIFAGRIVSGSPADGPSRTLRGASEPGDAPTGWLVRRMAATLPPELRPGFEAAVAKRRPDVEQAAGHVREARAKIREALIKEPFDRAALEGAFADLRARSDALQAALHAGLVDGAAGLPPEARKRLADWRTRARHR